MNRLMSAALVCLACVLSSSVEAIANDKIVAEFGSKIAQAMCADGGAWLDAYKKPRESCPGISQSVLSPCMTKLLEGRAIPLNSEGELQQLSENLYACMKDLFMAQYGGSAS